MSRRTLAIILLVLLGVIGIIGLLIYLYQIRIEDSSIVPSETLRTGYSIPSVEQCGDEKTLTDQEFDASSSLVSLPIYKLPPYSLTGNVKNENIDQRTTCSGFVIEQNHQGLTITNSSGEELYQGPGGSWGMFLDNLSVFQYENRDYFIAGSGDCGNQSCIYIYYVLSINSAGNVIPFNQNITYSTGRTVAQPLWTTEYPVGETIYAQGNSIYIVTGDGDYLNAIILNTNGTIENVVSGGATSTDPINSVPSEIEKLLLVEQG